MITVDAVFSFVQSGPLDVTRMTLPVSHGSLKSIQSGTVTSVSSGEVVVQSNYKGLLVSIGDMTEFFYI